MTPRVYRVAWLGMMFTISVLRQPHLLANILQDTHVNSPARVLPVGFDKYMIYREPAVAHGK